MSKTRYTQKGVFHIHSVYSGRCLIPFLYESTSKIEDILDYIIARGIKIIALSDHDTMDGVRKAQEIIKEKKLDVILIPSCEISSKHGHILAYNISRPIKKGLSAEETVKKIHDQGGIAVAAHPFNILGLHRKLFSCKIDALEAYNSATLHLRKKVQKASIILNVPCIGGSDAHNLHEIDNATIKFPSYVKTPEQIVECIKKGNFSNQVNPMNFINFARYMIWGNILLYQRLRKWLIVKKGSAKRLVKTFFESSPTFISKFLSKEMYLSSRSILNNDTMIKR